VVFVTAYDEYALQAFEVQALDYVLKPVSPSRFAAVLDRARRQAAQGRAAALTRRLEALLARLDAPPRYLERILVERDGRGVLLSLDQVDRIEADRNYVRLHSGGSVYPLRHAIGSLAERLDPARFLRLSRSEIVRLDAVREFQAWFHGDTKVILRDGTELTWSRRYRARQRPGFALD
jgi:two-component system LytT family response regulator